MITRKSVITKIVVDYGFERLDPEKIGLGLKVGQAVHMDELVLDIQETDSEIFSKVPERFVLDELELDITVETTLQNYGSFS